MKDRFTEKNRYKLKTKIPMTASNDVANFDDPIEARRFIRGFVQRFKRNTGNQIDYVDTNAGRIILDSMTDDEALFVAKDFRRMEQEARR